MPLNTLLFDDNNDWATNWAAFDNFVREWLQISFIRNSKSPYIEDLELAAGIELPPSMREWCAFFFASDQIYKSFTFRDYLIVKRLEKCDSYSLLYLAEGESCWAIESNHLLDPDPPVVGYFIDYDSGPTPDFVRLGLWAPTITSFTLDYFFSHMANPGDWSLLHKPIDPSKYDKLIADFGQPTQFGHLEMFLANGILVVIVGGGMEAKWGMYDAVHVRFQKGISSYQLPESVLNLRKGKR